LVVGPAFLHPGDARFEFRRARRPLDFFLRPLSALGLDQCNSVRRWLSLEMRAFQAIGHIVAAGCQPQNSLVTADNVLPAVLLR